MLKPCLWPSSPAAAHMPYPPKLHREYPAACAGYSRFTIWSTHRTPHPLPSHIEGLRQHARLSHHGHEIRISHPSRQHVHVNMSRNSRPSRLADVHPQVDSIRTVKLAQHRLHALRKRDHFIG